MEAKHLCVYRFTSATVICVFIQYFLLTFAVLITNTNPLTPIQWVFGTIKSMLSISTLLYLVPIGGLTVANGVMLLQNQLSSKKLGEISKGLRKLLKYSFLMFTGLLLTWVFLRFLNEKYGAMVVKETKEYNLKCLYLILSGIATVGHFISKRQSDTIEFPVVQQKKYIRVKAAMYTNLWKALVESVFPSFLCGLAVTTFMGVSVWTKNLENESILGLIIDYRLYFYTWLLFAHISCSLVMIKVIFEILFTDYQEFPIEKRTLTVNDTSLTLADALCYTKIPLIQTLAALDFYVLSETYNTARRNELFALSNVGGHPHNFRKVNEASLKAIQEFIDTLSDVVNTKKPMPVKKDVTPPVNNNLPPFTPVSPMRHDKPQSMGIRNMIVSPTINKTNVQNDVKSPLKPASSLLSPIKIKQSLHCNVPSTIRSFFGEDKSKKVNQILTNYSEKVSYISQAIASVAVFSLAEDKYGVVQDSLPKIIKTLLELHQILEKINAMSLVAKKSNRSYITIRQAAKRSLFKMVKEFQVYFNDMVLDIGTVDALRSFIV